MNRDLVGSLAWAGGIVALALGATAARRLGYMDGDSVTRLVVAANGLMLIWMGNRIPKAISPGACGQQAKRVAGWSMVLSGLVYTALWVFAPIQVAVFGGCGAIALGIAVTAGYCLSLRRRARMNAGRS